MSTPSVLRAEGGTRIPPAFPAAPVSQDTDAQRKEDDVRAKLESAPEPAGGTPLHDKYDHPTAKIWSVYMSEATPYDKGLIDSWSKDMDGILIFAGLFSATVTAFIIESYKGLMQDPNDTMVALLRQISQQLAADTAVQNPTLSSEPFSPSSSALRVNACWFISLCLALTCALAATLVQQWARHYTQAIHRRPAPHLQAPIRAYLFKGMEQFKMSAVVEGIPTLLHASVFLFFAGLVDFLYQINLRIAVVALSIIATCGGLYLFITILPVVHRQSPFRTPLSELCWDFSRFTGALRYRSGTKWYRLTGSMAEGRELLAGPSHTDHATMARTCLTWTLKNLTEDTELQPFVEGIPAFCTQYEDADVMMDVMMDQDIQLLPRIMALLRTCGKSSSLKPDSRRARTITCLNALAKLCEVHSADPWAFLLAYEPALRALIIPMTTDSSDQQIADAAKIVQANVVKHIISCCLIFPDPAKKLCEVRENQERRERRERSDRLDYSKLRKLGQLGTLTAAQRIQRSQLPGQAGGQDSEYAIERQQIQDHRERWRRRERHEWQPFGPIFPMKAMMIKEWDALTHDRLMSHSHEVDPGDDIHTYGDLMDRMQFFHVSPMMYEERSTESEGYATVPESSLHANTENEAH